MSSPESDVLKKLQGLLFFIIRASEPLHTPPPRPRAPAPPGLCMIPRVGGAAGRRRFLRRSPVARPRGRGRGRVAVGEGGQVIPASRSNFFLKSRTRPHSLKGEKNEIVKGGGVLKGERWKVG
jgi:hypothetical protein